MSFSAFQTARTRYVNLFFYKLYRLIVLVVMEELNCNGLDYFVSVWLPRASRRAYGPSHPSAREYYDASR